MRHFQFRRRLPGRSALNVITWWIGVSTFVHIVLLTLYGLKRYGKERIPAHGPAIYVANHQSHLDPPILGVLVADRPFTSLARATLFRNPQFGWLIRQLGAIPLKQGESDTAAMKQALKELQAGRRVLIFPEGSRTPDGTIHPFQRGVMLLIKRAGVPVIPLAVDGAYDIWPTHRRYPRLTGRIGVMAGPPIEADALLENGPDAGLEHLRQTIETMRRSVNAKLRRATNGRYPLTKPADE